MDKQERIEELRTDLRRMARQGDTHNAITESLRSQLWRLENNRS